MNEQDWLADRFETHRAHLRSVAYRMLGSASGADDAVQEAWLRLSRSHAGEIDNPREWLTTVVARVCLDMLRSRRSRREERLDEPVVSPVGSDVDGVDPEEEALLADSVGLALLVVLDTLTPAERVAFVLHDLFAVPFDDIAPIVQRSPTAARKLASRARIRVQGASTASDTDFARRRQIVDAFLAASRGGEFDRLMALLDPAVVLRADAAAVLAGAEREVHGAATVAETFAGRARGARPALVSGAPGLIWAHGGQPRVAFRFTFTDGKVAAIDLIADPEHLRSLDLAILDY